MKPKDGTVLDTVEMFQAICPFLISAASASSLSSLSPPGFKPAAPALLGNQQAVTGFH
jgi:hypothetical protein